MAPDPFDLLTDKISLDNYTKAEASSQSARFVLRMLAQDLHLDPYAFDAVRDPDHGRWIVPHSQAGLFRAARTQIVFAQPGATPEEAARATLAMLRTIVAHEPQRSKHRLVLQTHTRQFHLVP